MFGRKRKELLQEILDSAQKDRDAFAEQANKDRLAILDMGNKIISATQKTEEPAIEKGNELKAAYALNLCTVSVSQIIDYNDLVIMEQEYENILNNLNLQNFPKDYALLKILKQILDVVSFFRIQDGEKKILEEQYKKKVKDAVWSAVPSPSVILAGGKAGWAGLAVSAISAVGTGYMNYRKERANIDLEKTQKDWELQKAALEQFHALRRELFDTAWRLSDTYNFKDSHRLTERQITQYNRILVEEDAQKRYERLDYIKNYFDAYPPFWYHLGHAAAEVFHDDKKQFSKHVKDEYKDLAIKAFDKFMDLTDEDRKNSLLREDQLRAACALEKFAVVSLEQNVSQEYKIELLKIAAENSGNAFDTLQLCASAYLQIGATKEAIILMRMLVNEDYNAIMNAQLLSMLYISNRNDENQKYQFDYETLKVRGYKNYMLPWPQENNSDVEKEQINAFIESQNEFLFQEYKRVVGDYILQSRNVFNDIIKRTGDITDSLVEFLKGIKKDVAILFGNEDFAQKVCDQIALNLMKHETSFYNERTRKDNTEFSFDLLCDKIFVEVALMIKEQAYNVRNAIEEEKMKKISNYMGNLMLFKAQIKVFGGTAINQVLVDEEKSEFAKLIRKSSRNQADAKLINVIKRYAKENNIILHTNEKQKANFIIENLFEAKHVKHKENVRRKNAIAYLDTDKMDILFTTEGLWVYSKGSHIKSFFNEDWGKTFVRYNTGGIKLIENKKLKLGKKEFEHEQVDIKVLNEMIETLSNLVSKPMGTDKKFEEMVGDFPEKVDIPYQNRENDNMSYCVSV